MAPVFKPLDFLKLTGRGYVNFACALSDDDRIVILSDIGIYVVAIKPNLDSAFMEFSCQKTFIPISKYSICNNVDMDLNTFIHELPKELIYESIARIELSSNMNGTALVEPLALTATWSDSGMVGGTECLLGVLTQLYSLDIYMRLVDESDRTEYHIVLNITDEMLKRKKNNFVYSNRLPAIQKYKEFKKRIECVAPVAFCWSHTYKIDNHAYGVIFTGHLHGIISIWKVFTSQTGNGDLECEFLGEYKTILGDISCLNWYKTQEFGGALCLGDIDGKIVLLQVTELDKSECVCDNEVQFCKDKDHVVDKLTMFNINEYTILVAVKQCYLFFYVINASGNVTDFSVHNVDNLYITGLSHYDDKLQVLTFTGSFKELTLSIHYGKISIEEKTLPIKIEMGFRTHGFVVTKQRVLTGIFLSPYKLTNSIKGKQFVHFQLFFDSNINPLQMLMDNASGTLAKHWDCIETLRLICVKEQRFPWLGIDPLMDYDSLSLLQLKTMRIVAKLSETVFVTVKEVRNYDIKPFILLQYLVDIKLIVERLTYLFDLKYSGKKLTPFQLTSMELQIFFLKESVMSGILLRAEVGKHFIEEITRILQVANEMTFPEMIRCRLCGEKLIGATCLPPHADARCCLTLHPIFIAPSYKCNICGSLAHHEAFLERNNTACPYCDIPMQKISVEQSIQDAIKEQDNDKDIKSPCFTDCVTEVVDYADLEDNDVEVTFVSDNEVEETLEGGNALIEMYSRISKLNLDDISDNWHIEPVSNQKEAQS